MIQPPVTLETRLPELIGSLEQVASWITSAPQLDGGAEMLLDLLAEEHPIYSNRSWNEIVLLRGQILLALVKVPTPPEGLVPFLVEIFESERTPYLVACACMALKSLRTIPSGVGPLLLKSFHNVRLSDEKVCLDNLANETTAIITIFQTLEWLGLRACDTANDWRSIATDPGHRLNAQHLEQLNSAIETLQPAGSDVVPSQLPCCDEAPSLSAILTASFSRRSVGESRLPDILIQDQDGHETTTGAFFSGTPTVVAFFYTRCTNPGKCSMTISNLSLLQRELEDRGLNGVVRLAAFTYDPRFDLPQRLRNFGENRHFVFDSYSRFFRTLGPIDPLKQAFGLGVNYVGSVVNHHKVEVYLLDASSCIVASFERSQCDPRIIADKVAGLLRSGGNEATRDDSGEPESAGRLRRAFSSVIPALGVALMPKCPICVAAYLSMLGIGGLHGKLAGSILQMTFYVLVAFHGFWLVNRLRRIHAPLLGVIYTLGLASLIASVGFGAPTPISWIGVGLIAVASILASPGQRCDEPGAIEKRAKRTPS